MLACRKLEWRFIFLFAVLLFICLNSASAQPDDPTAETTPEASSAYFVVADDGINYLLESSGNDPCYYSISGNVTDLYGVPYIDFVANLKLLTTESSLVDQPDEYGYPGTDTALYRSDPSGWNIWFLGQPGDYELWLTTAIGGMELSPRARISIPDCSHSFVTVDYIQVHTVPGQTPSNVPLIVSVTSFSEETRFVLENNEISYSYAPTLGMPCYYLMEGQIQNRNGEPLTDLIVNIQMLEIEDLASVPTGYAFPTESGWSSLLPSWSVNYEVWLSAEIGGEELSPHIIVETSDCIHNLMRINFVEAD